MKTRFAFAFAFAALTQSALAADPYFAQVDAGFAAMLSHQPYCGPTAVTVARGNDVAAALIHARLEGQEQAVVANSHTVEHDAVAASFDRMLGHQAYTGATGVHADRANDYQVDRLVFARRLEQNQSGTLVASK